MARLTLLCLFVFAARGAHDAAGARAGGGEDPDKELKRAEAVLLKLRGLEAAAASEDPRAFARAARKLYPELFDAVSKLRRGGDLRTDLSTAVALYEAALRAGGAAADCASEPRGVYARLCAGAGGSRARLLRAKARLHAAWAEASLRHARGARDAATLDTLALVGAERAVDREIAVEALRVLKELTAGPGGLGPEDIPGRLEQLDRLLAPLPRGEAAAPLREARAALRDGLYWRLKSGAATALVVDASSYAAEPGALPRLGLRADDAERAADANLRAALNFIKKAEEALGL